MSPKKTQRLFLNAAAGMANHLLSVDADTRAALAELDGKVFELRVLGFTDHAGFSVFVLPSAQGVRLQSEYDSVPDVSISGTPSALLRMVSRGNVGVGDVEINGSLELAQRLQLIIAAMELDWEEYLSRYVGPMAAGGITEFTSGAFGFVRFQIENLSQNVGEYLRYEKACLVDQTELEEFCQATRRLRDDAERLLKRAQRLEDRL